MLQPAGMPTSAFSLVFDAPLNDLQAMFDFLKRAAWWQESLEECYKRRVPNPTLENSYNNQRTDICHISDNFVQIMKELVPSSTIRFENIFAGSGHCWTVKTKAYRYCRQLFILILVFFR